nr:GGDEF domain-containing protein [uncultured Sulfurimonas sp.]
MENFSLLHYSLVFLIVLLLISLYFNIKQRKQAKEREESDLVLIKKAYFDAETNLPNKNNIEIIINEQIARASRHKKSFIVASIKVLNYHEINIRSKSRAQELIIESSDRLLNSIRNEDILSRICDNGFIIVFNEYLEEENLNIILKRINLAFEEQFKHDRGSLNVQVSIGKSIYPHDATESQELINDAVRKSLN